jgi:outer membrane protein
MNKQYLSALLAALTLGSGAYAVDKAPVGVVNFAACITESKSGQKEQESMENIRKQMSSMIEDTEKELKEISAKFEDTEFLDSLSPKAEEEMKLKYQTLQEDLGRYQNQFYQVLQQAQYQLVQKMSGNIAKAAEIVAKEHKLDYVINKEACFYIRSDLDVTHAVISEMDKTYTSGKKLSENGEEPKNQDETLADKAR